MNKIDKLIQQKKELEARIKKAQADERGKARDRIFNLAAEAGISSLPDEVLKAAFFRIFAEQKMEKTEGVSNE